ncbi:MAG: hypothetical protein MJ211_00865 [Bacteroidales bacterium]|nr:hypothetical protein [Bacteroidales bacterium]
MSELQMENAELLAQGESASYGCRMVCHYNPYWYCDIMYTSTGYTERCPDSYPN